MIQPQPMMNTSVLSDWGENTDHMLLGVDIPVFTSVDSCDLHINQAGNFLDKYLVQWQKEIEDTWVRQQDTEIKTLILSQEMFPYLFPKPVQTLWM